MAYNFSEDEVKEIREKMNSISDRIPNHLAGFVWNTYRNIKGSNEKQPCSCGSAARHWRKAVDTINSFLKEYDNN